MRPIRRRAKKPFPLGSASEGEADTSDNGDGFGKDEIPRPEDANQVVPGVEQLWGEEERRIYAASLHFNANVSKPIRRFITDVVKEASLPEPWAAWRDEQGRWFFHNRVTSESRWPHPLTPIFKELTNICSQVIPMSIKDRDQHLQRLHADWTLKAKQELSQWQEAVGEDGQRKYFYNISTREASHFHPDSTVLPGHRCRLQALAMLNGPGYLDQIQQAASPSRARRSPGSALRTAKAIDRLILDSEPSSGAESSTSEAGRKGISMPQQGPVLLAEDARRKTMGGRSAGLPVQSWMKGESYGQKLLGLQLEEEAERRILQILGPVLDQELPWPWICEEEREVFSRQVFFWHSISKVRSDNHPMQSFHVRMVDMLRKVDVLRPQEELVRPALKQLMEEFEQGLHRTGVSDLETDVQLEMTSTLALALISCRIIGQQLGIAPLEYPINPWGQAAEAVKKHLEAQGTDMHQDVNVTIEVPPGDPIAPQLVEVYVESTVERPIVSQLHVPSPEPSPADEPLRRAEMRAEAEAQAGLADAAMTEAVAQAVEGAPEIAEAGPQMAVAVTPPGVDAEAQTSICLGAEVYIPGSPTELHKDTEPLEMEHPPLDEQLKEMCALIQAMRSQQEAAEAEVTEDVSDPPVDVDPSALATVSQPKSQVIPTMQGKVVQRQNILARSAMGDLWSVPAPGLRKPVPPDGSPPNSVRRRAQTLPVGSESFAWSGGFGVPCLGCSVPLQEPHGPQIRPVPRQLPQGPEGGREPRLWPGDARGAVEQPEPEVPVSPCSTRATRLGDQRSLEVVLELQELREQVKQIKQALSPESLQKQVVAMMPTLEKEGKVEPCTAVTGEARAEGPALGEQEDPLGAKQAPPKEEEDESAKQAPPKEEEDPLPAKQVPLPKDEEDPPIAKQVEDIEEAHSPEASVPSCRPLSSSPGREVAELREELQRVQQQAEVSTLPTEAIREALAQASREMAELKESEEARVAGIQMELDKQKQVSEELSQRMSQNEADIARKAEEMSNTMEKKLELLRESAERATQQAHEVIMRSAEHEMRRQLELKAQRELRWRAEHRELQLKAEMTEMRMKNSWQAIQQLEEAELQSPTPGSTPNRSRDRMPRSHSSLQEALHYAASQGSPVVTSKDEASVAPATPQEHVSVTLEFTNESLDDARLAQRVAQDLAPRLRNSSKEKPSGSHPSRPGTPVRSPFSARSVCSVRSAQAARRSTPQLGPKRPQSASAAGRPPFDGVLQGPVTWNGVANSVNRWYELQRRAESRLYNRGHGRLIRYRG